MSTHGLEVDDTLQCTYSNWMDTPAPIFCTVEQRNVLLIYSNSTEACSVPVLPRASFK